MILTFYIRNFGCFELCCVIIPVVVRCLLVAYIHFFRCQIGLMVTFTQLRLFCVGSRPVECLDH